ncbi:NUDIX hydrolase [Clostridium sp.]|jgi:ADP-ribose pyrophosphatase YjhB (NUDIX family)|uniref:NUDIX hydrolase n=1 Tax=Clostridium sp. TaxID=1506 RepID=UPI0039F54784
MNWIESIKNYNPYNEQEKKDKEIIVECIDKFCNVLTRDSKVAHITSSAFVVNKTREKALMVYHNIYNSWSWTGGHADGEKDLLAVALREVQEETCVKNLIPISEKIFSLDVLPVIGHVKRGEYVSPHLHLSVAYLVEGDEKEELIVKADENSGVKWIPIDEINICCNEEHMKKVYEKIVRKMNDY